MQAFVTFQTDKPIEQLEAAGQLIYGWYDDFVEYIESTGVLTKAEDELGMEKEEFEELVKQVEVSHIEYYPGFIEFSFGFNEYTEPGRPWDNPRNGLYELFSVVSLLFPEEKILLETYDDYKDYREHAIFEDGMYEEYDGRWTRFDIYDYEEIDGDYNLSLSSLDISIDVDDYYNSEASVLYFINDETYIYILKPNGDVEKISDEEDE